ncbi:MAG TPA: gamma-glutamyl-gamma-aminobutyrate hydrolase family protein [Pyrinomonadaceae bacterium]|nr:gamma-glutamyl-gamma-aminobutyrate hydrolase family protein [Pyrinomonadaceae bacterium]
MQHRPPRRPKIGITTRLDVETGRFYLGRDYSDAVVAAGGIPVHIPLITDREVIESLVGGIDGVLLPGSDTDPDPAYYGEDPHPSLKKVVPEKDETDLAVLAAAEERSLPVFAICYGMQILNVSRGGSLFQDIGSQISGALKHEQGIPLARPSHSIRVASGSPIDLVDGNGSRRVNSHHHQSVKDVGRGLEPIAWANDGVIEAISDTRKGRFVVGVQWHPELSFRTDELSRRLFARFVNECSINDET